VQTGEVGEHPPGETGPGLGLVLQVNQEKRRLLPQPNPDDQIGLVPFAAD